MLVQIRLLIIEARGKRFSFRVKIHKAETPAEQLIEPAFYQCYAKKVHEGTHYEMELVESPLEHKPDMLAPIHVHKNPVTEKVFVCYTGQIPTLEGALAVLRMWCLGTVYTLIFEQDFDPLVGEAGSDFVGFMRDHFGIVLVGDMEYIPN